MGTHAYRAFGLSLGSNIPLPELVPGEAEAYDVEIRGCGDVRELAGDVVARQYDERPAAAELRWPQVTAGVRQGRTIDVSARADTRPQTVRLFLLGPTMAALLRQRGAVALHASSVDVDGSAVGFMGWCGWGKSSTAGALHALGFPLVADDLLAVTADGRAAACAPAFPRLRLSEAMADHLGLDVVERCGDKVVARAERGFEVGRRPLAGLYLLERASSTSIEPLTPGEALRELLRHSFAARWLGPAVQARHLRTCAALAAVVPLFRLRVRDAPDEIRALGERVVAHSRARRADSEAR